MAVQDYKINYKSDFVLNINGDAGWATQFCIKFWTGMPSQAYFVGFDGVKYVNCRVGDTPTQLLVMFDDHHLPIGPLRMQIAYHTTIEEFPGSVFDEVTNARDVIVTIDGTDYQVLLDFTGEDAPELEFDLPAYANEAERIQNELQRQQNEAARIAAELQREQATAAAVQGAENVNAQLNGTTLTVTNRQGVSTSVNTKGEQGEQGPVGPEGPQGEQGVSIVSFRQVYASETATYYSITFSDGHEQSVAIPKGAKGDTGATGPTGPQGPQGETGVSITGFVETGETETATLYNITFSDGTTQQVAIPKGEKGDQGPVGPQGPQGPMGDVAVITPEQQAAFTMYSTTGQNTDGPMTQKAVTDALVGSSIWYDNSQSGLAAENVQGALDEVGTETFTDETIISNIRNNSTYETVANGWFYVSNGIGKWLAGSSRRCYVYQRGADWDKIKVTANANNGASIFFLNKAPTIVDGGTETGYIGKMPNVAAGTTSDAYSIPDGCTYIVANGYPVSSNDFSPTKIEIIEKVSVKDIVEKEVIPHVETHEISDDDSNHLFNIVDNRGNILAYWDINGNFVSNSFFPDIVTDQSTNIMSIVDTGGNILAYWDANGNFKAKGLDSSHWSNKIWYAYGTSLTAYNEVNKVGKYPAYLAALSGLELHNKGIGSAGISSYSNEKVWDAVHDLTDGKLDADLITLETYANDGGAPLGTVYDMNDNTTFCGALNLCIRFLQENTNAQIVVMSSTRSRYRAHDPSVIYYGNETYGPDNHTILDAYNAIEQVCKNNACHYIPLGETWGVGLARANANDLYIADWIHHTNLGGRIAAEYIWSILKDIPLWRTSL